MNVGISQSKRSERTNEREWICCICCSCILYRSSCPGSRLGLALTFKDGPRWSETIKSFSVSIPTSVIRAEHTKHPFVAYCLETHYHDESTSATIKVERRFKQFEALHLALVESFPMIALPQLPPKSIALGIQGHITEYRKKALQCYLTRIIRHPLLRSTELLTTFLSTEDDRLLGTTCELWSKRAQEHCFFEQVLHPDWNQTDGELARVEEIMKQNQATGRYIRVLLEKMLKTRSSASAFVTTLQSLGRAMAEWSEDCDASTTNEQMAADYILQSASQTVSSTRAAIEHLEDSLDSSLALLLQLQHMLPHLTELHTMHNTIYQQLMALRKFPEVDNEYLEARLDTLFNIILAEMNTIDEQRLVDLQTISRSLTAAQLEGHKDALSILQTQARLPLSMGSRRYMLNMINQSETPRNRWDVRGKTAGLMRLIRSYM